MKKRARRASHVPGEAVRTAVATAGPWTRVEQWIGRYAAWLAVGMTLLATARIISTYTTFSYTFDEPAHIACGMEWLEKHTYTYEPHHPPLTRIAVAVLPKLWGAHGWNQKSTWDEGLAILSGGGGELNSLTLALARAGTLPFFWITCWITFACTRWISGNAIAAAVAVLLLTMTPSILAHAGLATTDMGLTAMLLLAIYSGWRWLEEPVMGRAVSFGVCTGLAVLSKFSTLAFLPSVAVMGLLIWCVFERPVPARVLSLVQARGMQFLAAVAAAVLVVWAGYFFSVGSAPTFSFRVPAPELFRGVEEVRKHDSTGHLTYLLGAANTVGWPYFYVVALGVKTPVPILALGLGGLGLLFSRKLYGARGWIMPSTVLGILIFSSFFTKIRIGTRHVLPVLVAFAIAGGCTTVWALRRWESQALARYAVGLVLICVPVVSLAAHPDYLAYFNFAAGDKPEAFLVDSDLDWGQDVKRLAKRLKELDVREIYFNQYAPGDLRKLFGFPPIRPLDFNGPQPGWNAVSLTPMKYGLFGDARYIYDRGFQFWPDQMHPDERVGRGILLFYRRPGR